MATSRAQEGKAVDDRRCTHHTRLEVMMQPKTRQALSRTEAEADGQGARCEADSGFR